jgi:hypothetical protein
MNKRARMQLFFKLLATARPCTDVDDAYRQIETILNAIEERHSGVPYDPGNWKNDSRLYMPLMDNSSHPRDCRGVTKLWSFGQSTLIAPNGAYLIKETRSEPVVLEKAGHDGRAVSAFGI